MKSRKGQLTGSSSVLKDLLETGILSDQFTRWKLWRKWPEIVGQTLAQNTDPVGYYRRTLVVWVKNASWLQQLSFASDPIKEKVNAFLGKEWIYRVRFTIQKNEGPHREKVKRLFDSLER